MDMGDSDATNYFRDLYELGADPSTSLEEKISAAITIGRDRLDVPYGVLSYTGEGQYEVVDSTIESGAYVAGSVHDVETTWCRHVVGDRELLAITDAGDSDYFDDVAREATELQCYIGAPILVDGETFGTLCYSGTEPRGVAFSDDEKRFVRLLTRWIGYELERAKHYERLDRQNARLDEFAGVLAHDLRNPLTSARGYTELVSESLSGQEREHLTTAIDALDRMEGLVTDTLSLARDGGDVGEREPIELGAVARTTWKTVEPTDATLVVEGDRDLLADESRLRQLFESLFRNVEKHCPGETTVTVTGTETGFVVADDGPGIPTDIAASLFGGDLGSAQVGRGLLIVERVVSGHGWGGEIVADDGTRLVVTGVDDAATRQPPVDH